MYNRKKPSKIFGNLFQSKYSAFLLLLHVMFFYFYMAIALSTLAFLYKKAMASIEPPKHNKYIQKLEEIGEKLEKQKQKENANEDLLKK